jgi:hypothetical protein
MEFAKSDQDEARQAFLPKARGDSTYLEKGSQEAKLASRGYWRLVLEIFMASVIVVLLTCLFLDRERAKPTPVPNCMFIT